MNFVVLGTVKLLFNVVCFQRRPLERFVLHHLFPRRAKTADHGKVDMFVSAESVIVAENNNTGCLVAVLDCTLVHLGMNETSSCWFDLQINVKRMNKDQSILP